MPRIPGIMDAVKQTPLVFLATTPLVASPVLDLSVPFSSEPRPNAEGLLTAKDVAGLLSVSLKRVYELGIPAVHISARALRWRLADVQAWIQGRVRP